MAAEPGGAQGAVCFWRPQVEVFLWPCTGSEGPLADGAGLPLVPSPELSWLIPAAYLSVTAQGGLFRGKHLFSDKRNPSPLDVKDFCAPSPGVTATSSSVTKVPHLHRCPRPRVTSSSHARAALLSGAVRSEGRPLPVCPHRGPGLPCWLLRRLLWAGWGRLPLCWCGERAWPCVSWRQGLQEVVLTTAASDLNWRV